MKFWLAIFLIFCCFFVGCYGTSKIEIKDNLSTEDQKIAFRRVLEEQYKTGDFQNAFTNFEKIANQGDLDAKFFLAVCYKEGRGVIKDQSKSIEILKDLASKNHPLASGFLAKLLNPSSTKGPQTNNDEWLSLTQKLADAGDKKSWIQLAQYYEKNGSKEQYFKTNLGLANYFFDDNARKALLNAFLSGNEGTTRNLREAIYWICQINTPLKKSPAAKNLSPQNQNLIDFVVDQQKAYHAFKKGKKMLSTESKTAQINRILNLTPQQIHFARASAEKNQVEAIALLKKHLRLNFEQKRQKLIELKDGDGLFNLAIEASKYEKNIFPPNSEHILKVLEVAASYGNTDAMLMLGDVMTGYSKDSFDRGLTYYKEAMSHGAKDSYSRIAAMIKDYAVLPTQVREMMKKTVQDLLEKGVESGSSEAMVELAKFLSDNSENPPLEKIEKLLEKAVSLGNSEGKFTLAKLLLSSSKKDQRAKAIRLLDSAANKGHSGSISRLIQVKNEDGESYSMAEIQEWLKKANKKDIPRLHLFLIEHNRQNHNYREAYKWLMASDSDSFSSSEMQLKSKLKSEIVSHLSSAEIRVISRSELESRDSLEKMEKQKLVLDEIKTDIGLFNAILKYHLLDDNGLFEDREMPRPIYEKLQQMAKADPFFCGFFLGAIQDRSYSFFYAPEKALLSFKASAEAGNPLAMVSFGISLQSVSNTPFSCEEADEWFSWAADKNYEEGKLQMGFKYVNSGEFEKAFNIFTELANNKNVWGMLSLANLYEKGKGTKKDLYQATALYQKAAQKELLVYPFYARAYSEWKKNPSAEALGPFSIEETDPAEEAAKRAAEIDRFFDKIINSIDKK